MLVDTHTHIEGEEFDIDRDLVLSRCVENEVGIIINASFDLVSSKKAVALAEKVESVYACIGVHPNDCAIYDDKCELEIIELAKHNKVVGIGEIGLDYHYDGYDKKKQFDTFLRQIDIAKNANLPVVVHSRDADKDTFDILKSELIKGTKILLHCYGSSYEMAKEYVKLGAYLGIGGVLTFKNAKKLVEVVENIGIEHLVLETDAPYLTPTPFRGKRNEPFYVKYTAQKIADLKNMSFEEVARITTKNAKGFYGI